MAPIPEAIFLVNLSIWLLQVRLSSISTPSGLAVVTCSIGERLIEGLIDQLCPYYSISCVPNIESVLLIYRSVVSLIFDQLYGFIALNREDWRV